MVVVICSICGEPAPADSRVCPLCEASDMRAVPEQDLPPTPDERLLTNVHHTLEAFSRLRQERVYQLAEGKERALRERLVGQMGVVEARLQREREQREAAAYREALERLKRELSASL